MGKSRRRDGLPEDAREWTADDWRDLNKAIAAVKRVVARRHAADPALHLLCPFCSGTGRVELGGEYRATFGRLRDRPGEFTAAQVAREWDVPATRINNQLAALERHGLLASRRSGRERLYRVADAGR